MCKENYKKFGINLRKIRKQQGLSQEKIALELDMDLTTISKYELGSRCPNLKIAYKIAEVLGVKLSEMVD